MAPQDLLLQTQMQMQSFQNFYAPGKQSCPEVPLPDPPPEELNCMLDAVCRFGFVVLNRYQIPVAWGFKRILGCLNSEDAELFGIKEAVLALRARGIQEVLMLNDNLNTITRINKATKGFLNQHALVAAITRAVGVSVFSFVTSFGT